MSSIFNNLRGQTRFDHEDVNSQPGLRLTRELAFMIINDIQRKFESGSLGCRNDLDNGFYPQLNKSVTKEALLVAAGPF